MGKFKNYYQVLDLEPFATSDTVKTAFRALARKYHPDLNPGDRLAEERFKDINEAYDVLSNPAKKQAFDHSLRIYLGQGVSKKNASQTPNPSGKNSATAAAKGKGKAGGKNAASPPPKNPQKDTSRQNTDAASSEKQDAQGIPINEFFENFLKKGFSGSSEKSTSSSGSSWKENSTVVSGESGPKRRGQDVSVDVTISPFEAQQGIIKTVNVQHQEICKRCSGTGLLNGASCPQCNGDKILARLKKIDVRIPAGVKNGSKVRVAREGGRGINGGDAGDLFLVIQISYDPAMRVEGLTVYSELPISVTTAVLGGEVDVPTMNGSVKMNIPPGTASGKVFRLREQGVQNGQHRGDQLVTVVIVPPRNLSTKEKELYEELARLRPEPPTLKDL